MQIHYVYKIIDTKTGQYYFGSKSSNNPENDGYMGSMKTWKPEDKTRLIKEIIKYDFKTRESAIEYESNIIKKHINDELNENYYIPNVGFHTLGNKKVSEKISRANKGKKPWNCGKMNIYSEDTIKKMSNSAKGRIISKSTRDKISKSNKGKLVGNKNPMYNMIGNKNPNYGNHWTDEMKKNLSEKFKGKIRRNPKSVLQYDLYGNFIKEWESIKSASSELNIRASGISNSLSGKYNHSGGYVWKYKNITIE